MIALPRSYISIFKILNEGLSQMLFREPAKILITNLSNTVLIELKYLMRFKKFLSDFFHNQMIFVRKIFP